MNDLNVVVTPHRAALLAGHDNDIDVLVRVQAPGIPDSAPQRQPLNLALVIDRSGSMSGQPLDEAKRCASMIVDSLAPEDYLSVSSYDNRVSVEIPWRQVGTQSRAGLHRRIRTIDCGGTTALYDGWYEGAGQAARGVEQASVSRVLLLSDGQANAGLTDPQEIEQRCAGMADVGVTTSTYGLGSHFNEDLMLQMARAGRGNSYYGQTAEDLLDPFREEFELLRHLYARRLRLSLVTSAGVSCRLLNGYPSDAEGRWLLPDLAYGGEAWALVRLRVPRAMAQAAEPLLTAQLICELSDGSPISLRSPELTLPWLPHAAFLAVAADQLVVERLGELRAADLQDEARQAARMGDWDRVDALLAKARREAKNNPWLEEVVEALQAYANEREAEHLAKEALFSSNRLRNRLADANATCGDFLANEESGKVAYLRRKREQGKRFS
jgi:Ca-activated chloride channel family protein